MDRLKMKQVANKLMFNADEVVLDELEVLFNSYAKKIQKMQDIETNGVEPLVYNTESEILFLREDVPTQPLPKKDILKNASKKDDDFIIIGKAEHHD